MATFTVGDLVVFLALADDAPVLRITASSRAYALSGSVPVQVVVAQQRALVSTATARGYAFTPSTRTYEVAA
jgi:hypothetical protein